MKGLLKLLLGVFLATSSMPSSGAEAWLLAGSDRHTLMHATDNGFEPVVTLGDLTIFASAERKLILLSRDKAARQGKLVIVDKATNKIDASWPVDVYPVSEMAGPSRDLVLLGDFAYFASIRYGTNGRPRNPNRLGGSFDLNRISLTRGNIESFPLPKEILSPKLAEVNGRILVSNGVADDVFAFDEGSKSLVRVVATSDITGSHGSDLPWLPSGTVTELLEELMPSMGAEQGDPSAPNERTVLRLFPEELKADGTFGVLRKQDQRTQILYLNPSKRIVSWETQVAADIVPESILPLPDDSVLYVDATTNSVRRTSKTGQTVELWSIETQAPGSPPDLARIIDVVL